MRNDAVAGLMADEGGFPKGPELAGLRIVVVANWGRDDSKGRQLVHGRPLLMVRHFLRSIERSNYIKEF